MSGASSGLRVMSATLRRSAVNLRPHTPEKASWKVCVPVMAPVLKIFPGVSAAF